MANSYDIPSWAGKPPTGLHLDVLKEEKLVQKLMVDEKRCYLFGRNAQMNDFCIDHASCSRVHAVFVYHKHLNIAFLVDLGSTHGTFIGSLRLEAHKPTQLPINSTFHFGASTRNYILRERPTAGQRVNIIEDLPISETIDGTLLGLPESQTELDNLTEYNTAHNRRISILGIGDNNLRKPISNRQVTRRRRNVTFNEEEIIINPEDVDPNVGRFRNLIQTTVVPTKRVRYETNPVGTSYSNNVGQQIFQHEQNIRKQEPGCKQTQSPTFDSLYQGLPASINDVHGSIKLNSDFDATSIGTKLGLLLPNPAPDVNPTIDELTVVDKTNISHKLLVAIPTDPTRPANAYSDTHGPQKKKYAKEAWPGRKLMMGQF